MNKEFFDLISDIRYSDFTGFGLNGFDHTIEEFNTTDCKSVLQEYSMLQPFPKTSTKQSKLIYHMLKNYQLNSGSSTYYQ